MGRKSGKPGVWALNEAALDAEVPKLTAVDEIEEFSDEEEISVLKQCRADAIDSGQLHRAKVLLGILHHHYDKEEEEENEEEEGQTLTVTLQQGSWDALRDWIADLLSRNYSFNALDIDELEEELVDDLSLLKEQLKRGSPRNVEANQTLDLHMAHWDRLENLFDGLRQVDSAEEYIQGGISATRRARLHAAAAKLWESI